MKPEHILLIVAGGVYALMLFICCFIEFKKSSMRLHEKAQLHKSYDKDNLKKMEYDVAFYDRDELKLDFNSVGDEQVTIDDLLDQDETAEEKARRAIFAQYEDNGVKVIKGNYRPAG